MTIYEAIKERHSVRNYTDKKIPQDILTRLQNEIAICNKESALNIQLITDDSTVFDSLMAHYGKFSGVKNYIALVGKNTENLDERVGYYGERIALLAQTLGLNTCWVALTFRKSAVKSRCRINENEKLVCVLAFGYGTTQGVRHKSKEIRDVCTFQDELPKWFQNGIESALLAPTAMNQQKFLFSLEGNTVSAKATGGFYSKVDLGIVKYHFEIGAGLDSFDWK